MTILLFIIIGAVVGFLAPRVIKVDTNETTTIILGVVGGVIGGYIAKVLMSLLGTLITLLGAAVGALLAIWLWQRYVETSEKAEDTSDR